MNQIEIERRRRIKLTIWAYAYEFENHSIVSDAVFDVESCQVDLAMDTGKPMLDFWWRANFSPFTGMWIHKHPELDKTKTIYERFYKC